MSDISELLLWGLAAIGGAGVLFKIGLKYWPSTLAWLLAKLLVNPVARVFLTSNEADVMAFLHLTVDVVQAGIDKAQAEDAAKAGLPAPAPGPSLPPPPAA